MGGRSSASGLTVTVFGGSGHLGRHLVKRLGQIGTQVVIPYRGDEYDIMSLKLMGDLGRIHPIRFNLKDYASIVACVKDSDVVVNCINQDRRTLNFTMEQVNVDGARDIAFAAYEAGVPRFIHLSCLRAQPDAPSHYSRTKAEGETMVRYSYPQATIVRPATIVGPLDRFMNGIGQFTRMVLGFPLIDQGQAIRYPIHITNVADALELMVRTSQVPVEGKTYELVGPRAYTVKRLVELFAHGTMCPPKMINLSPIMYWLYGRIFPEIRRAPFPYDTIRQLKESERPHPQALGMADLGFGRLVTVEESLLAIVRKYRRTEDYGTPIIYPPELLEDSVPDHSNTPSLHNGKVVNDHSTRTKTFPLMSDNIV